MPKYNLVCNYCGNKWVEYLTPYHLDTLKCEVCRDSSVDYSTEEQQKKTSDIFGYNYKKKLAK